MMFDFQHCSKLSGPWWVSVLFSEPLASYSPSHDDADSWHPVPSCRCSNASQCPRLWLQIKHPKFRSVSLIFRCARHCWSVCVGQPDRAKFSVHDVCRRWVRLVRRRGCRWTHGNSNSEVNSNQDDVRSALALGYVFLWLFCSFRYTFGPALFVGWIGGAILAVDWPQTKSSGTLHHRGKQ